MLKIVCLRASVLCFKYLKFHVIYCLNSSYPTFSGPVYLTIVVL